MIKIIPRDKIKHLEWQAGQEMPVVNPVTNPTLQNTGGFNTDNSNCSFLEGDFGKTVLEEYNQLVQSEYQNISSLRKLSFADNVAKGSNPFSFVLLNRVLQNHGRWVARPADLERALENGAIDLSGTYGDSGLVLRTENNPNEYLAKNLASQVKGKGYNVGGDTVMIPLAGLEISYDSSSPYDLIFQLTDSSEIIYAPQLNKTNHGKKFNGADDKGLPAFENNGSRTLYSNEENGICRLCRYRVHDLVARIDDLTISFSDGRVIVCAEGTSK